ncbi:hypothetical protein TSAR_005300 [Trichomalopsis sarcophagae]|uniref:C-type lectin domain-containing protein n=1 Tax=Trichomalopsis sarcophagae TaxID=543379 RepID=A0A232F7F6_9HYME|nr:hypothetical protein TSAR_005300 [Trichomalopsis sarcophagae]
MSTTLLGLVLLVLAVQAQQDFEIQLHPRTAGHGSKNDTAITITSTMTYTARLSANMLEKLRDKIFCGKFGGDKEVRRTESSTVLKEQKKIVVSSTVLKSKGYKMVNSRWYKLIGSHPKSWNEARKACINDGGHLAVADNMRELEQHSPLRLSLRMTARIWATTLVLPIVFCLLLNFPAESLAKKSKEADVKVEHKKTSYKLKDHKGLLINSKLDYLNTLSSKKLAKICEKVMDKEASTSRRSAKGRVKKELKIYSKAGYIKKEGVGWYKVHVKPKTWEHARTACRKEGAHLVTVDSKKEAKVMQKLMKQAKADSVWIGIHDMFREGNWVTVLDQTFDGNKFLKWNTKSFGSPQPDNGGPGAKQPQNCGYLRAADRTLDDYWCSSAMPYICEVQIVNCSE